MQTVQCKLQIMDGYFEATTVHGFYYIHGRYSICTRLFWFCIVIAGFTVASHLIYHSLEDWKNDQTITTLDSISHPIQNVQFPTVTVCPNEQKQPDNWSFLEKYFNALAFSGSGIKFSLSIIDPAWEI